jgi:plasmid rolling circle replication initiator protein Rep
MKIIQDDSSTEGQRSQEKPTAILADKLSREADKVRRLHRMAESLSRENFVGKAERMRTCGSQLFYAYIPAENRAVLQHANFCRERLCPRCSAMRSRQVFSQVSQVMNYIGRERPELQPVFLTLTVKNCKAEDLSSTLDTIFQGWNRFMANDRMKRLIAGWFRALEVTYNEEEDSFHPHIHAILLMPPSYFKTPKDYMTTEKWVKTFRKALRLDYDPVCDIRAVKDLTEEDRAKAIAEVAKYTVKDTDILKDDEALTDMLVGTFARALKKRRLVAFGGLMKEVAKKLKLKDGDVFEPQAIRGEDGRVLRKDLDYILLIYRWCVGLSRYEFEKQI